MILLRLFGEFFKVGLFSVGGGMATLPFLYDLGERSGWFTVGDVADMLAVSESTPGPIGVNMATYVGYNCAGIPGGIVATLGLITPGIIIIILIAAALERFRRSQYVTAAFSTIRPASTGLIASAGLSVLALVLLNRELFQETGVWTDLFSWKSIALFVLLLAVTNGVKGAKKLHPIVFLLFSAVVGILFHLDGV